MRGTPGFDLTRDRPPDFALEIEISSCLPDRESIYAALGVPELWRFEGEQLRIFTLGEAGGYEARERSEALPGPPISELERFLALWNTMDDPSLVRSFRAWVRQHGRAGALESRSSHFE
ncbi:MAG: Uma2 family endonuclease [Planctomycetes bacterium]|nr:Uma2 family endonuclease [Planctomycetota bacterium]